MSNQDKSTTTDNPSAVVKTEPSLECGTKASDLPKPDTITSRLNFSPDSCSNKDRDNKNKQDQDTKARSHPMQICLVSQIITD